MLIPESAHYWLKNAHVPRVLLPPRLPLTPETREHLCLVHLEIINGKIGQIVSGVEKLPAELPQVDLKKGIVFTGFVDSHTHLDKGHIWERSPNLTGTFEQALATASSDAQGFWSAEDVYRRMNFGLKCSYAHGTVALRTHLDSFGKQAAISFQIIKTLQQEWGDRLLIQAVSLVPLDYYQTPAGIDLADLVAEMGGILGGVAYRNPDLPAQLDQVFSLAEERGLNLDFHADENGERESVCLKHIAQTALKRDFQGQIICGHCCSLSVQSPEDLEEILDLVVRAGISIVSLPMCNLYLQDRQPESTPYWRGVTKVHEIKRKGIAVAFASDNCRDPFYGFGDHDVLEVFNQSVRIAHLDTPYADWCGSITKVPRSMMGLPAQGIAMGATADLVIFKARYFSELFSRPQIDRIVLRQGTAIDTTLPDYSGLD